MPDKRIALVTGANQGVGLQVAKELVANGVTVLVGSRNFERGEAAAREIGAGAIALQLDADVPSVAIGCRRGRPLRGDTVSLAGDSRSGLFTAGEGIFTWSNLP
jgi:NAD(P)-dependent dehydrogenase (short-subunit alcohol dehydrogenase family)